MNSERLSARLKQPGHDQTYRASEANFIKAARAVLDPTKYEVHDHPGELRAIFGDEGVKKLGIVPEASIASIATGRKFFVEVKKQGKAGNADERACKHHTVQFYRALRSIYDYDFHPFVTIMCESLATEPRYTMKAPYFFEPGQYFLWADYDLDLLAAYLNDRCATWLDD